MCQIGPWWRVKRKDACVDLDSSFESADTSSGAISSGGGVGYSSGDGVQTSAIVSEDREDEVVRSDVEEV